MRSVTLARTAERSASWTAYLALTKPRITLMVVLTAGVGFFMASPQGVAALAFLHVLLGTAIVASAANTLNQYLEREADALMVRTSRRPLPTGRILPDRALHFGAVLGMAGVAYLALFLNLLTALLAAVTLASYVFLYTPLKQRTSWNTWIGAVPGALPPVGGWAAATGTVPLEAWVLFGIVFLWQIPHFLAIAWLLRADYERAGFRMLPVVDPGGRSTARQITLCALLLIPVSVTPALMGLTGVFTFLGAGLVSSAYAALSLAMAARPSAPRARRLFLGSLLVLPAIFAVMMLDKLPV